MNLRRNIFWLLDYLKGSPLKKLCQYTSKVLETEDREWVEAESAKNLQNLLKHAVETTHFYKNRDYDQLQDLPVVNKNLIRDNFDAFFSSKFKKSNCKIATTSGSTGAPFSVYQNTNKVRKLQADNIYFSSKSNFRLGDFLVYIKYWPNVIGLQMKLSLFIKNFAYWNIFNLLPNDIELLINKLNRRKTKVSLLTYPTALAQICDYIDDLGENPIKFKTKSIITISESLSNHTKERVLKYFCVAPISRYSNNETGFMAQQIKPDDSRFRINDSSYIMEVLSIDSDHQVPLGQPGRIVLTDLFNYATPLIRYDTGDIGIMNLDDKGVPYFTEIYGRKIDQLYDTKGNLISSHLSTDIMNFGEFNQFQLVQKSRTEYHFNVNTAQPVNESDAADYFKKYLGDAAVIKFNYVSEIPVLSSGKRREVVNEYYKS